MSKRVILIVLDSAGIGEMPDAAEFGDKGCNTIGHIWQRRPMNIPNMRRYGLGNIQGSLVTPWEGQVEGAYGKCAETTHAKDTTCGHWEIAGLVQTHPFKTYPHGFPKEVMEAFEQKIGRGTLGNCVASGTEIIQRLGDEHVKTGKPIVYTSADSVFQIAAHESVIPLEELYRICQIAREMLVGDNLVGRVIARPFTGTSGQYTRTENRRDYAIPPFGDTILDGLHGRGLPVVAVGKIEDIFCMRGITQSVHSAGNPACLQSLMDDLAGDFTGLCFVNLVDFDMTYGHRRDVAGYAQALRDFDAFLPNILGAMGDHDLLLITADHGCDPTWTGTDHTRERVPLLCWHRGMRRAIDLGVRNTYADMAATICEGFGLPDRFGATSFYQELEMK